MTDGRCHPIGRLPVTRAPQLGEHTEQILADVLGLHDSEIAALFDRGIVAGPVEAVA